MADEGTLQLILSHVQRQGAEISEIKQALVTLARVEERQASQREDTARNTADIKSLLSRVYELEKITGSRGMVYRWVERIGLVAAGGVVTKVISAWPWGQ